MRKIYGIIGALLVLATLIASLVAEPAKKVRFDTIPKYKGESVALSPAHMHKAQAGAILQLCAQKGIVVPAALQKQIVPALARGAAPGHIYNLIAGQHKAAQEANKGLLGHTIDWFRHPVRVLMAFCALNVLKTMFVAPAEPSAGADTK